MAGRNLRDRNQRERILFLGRRDYGFRIQIDRTNRFPSPLGVWGLDTGNWLVCVDTNDVRQISNNEIMDRINNRREMSEASIDVLKNYDLKYRNPNEQVSKIRKCCCCRLIYVAFTYLVFSSYLQFPRHLLIVQIAHGFGNVLCPISGL